MKEAPRFGLDIFMHAMKGGFRLEAEIVQNDSIYGDTGEYWNGMMVFEQKSTESVGEP